MNEDLTAVELYIIEAVQRKRLSLEMDAKDLSLKIGLDGGFVSRVENPKRRDKYNFNHLHEIAKVFDCSMSKFLPYPLLSNDCIQEHKLIIERKKEEAKKLREQKALKKSKNKNKKQK